MRILTGIQPSGKLHWGNYFGAMKSMFDLQEKGENFMFIANFHAMTTVRDGKALRAQTIAIFSYIDPVIAIILSVTVLHEPFSILSAVGSVLILGAAFVSEKT